MKCLDAFRVSTPLKGCKLKDDVNFQVVKGGGGGGQTSRLPYLAIPAPAPFFLASSFWLFFDCDY